MTELEAPASIAPIFRWPEPPTRWPARLSLAALYMMAGLLHVLKPDLFVLLVPDFVAHPKEVVLFTGICEMVGAFALLTRYYRKPAAIAFVLYAICVYPANIKHALYGLPEPYPQLGLWYHIPRLLLQPVFIWWALYAGALINWPFKKEAASALNVEALLSDCSDNR